MQLPYPSPRDFADRLSDSLTQTEVERCLGDLIAQLRMRRSLRFRHDLVQLTRECFAALFVEWSLDGEVSGYRVLPSRTALRNMAALIVCTCIPRKLEESVSLALKWVSSFTPPETTPISPEEVHLVLRETRLPLSTRIVGSRRPLLVFCIDGTDPNFNSSYQPALNAIFASAPRRDSEGADRTYVFLHEVGHALQVAITGQLSRIPASFLPVFKLTSEKDGGTVPKEDLAEVFADTFSIGASFETSLAASNPFCGIFPHWVQVALCRYFELLVDSVFTNLQTLPEGDLDMKWTQATWDKYVDSLRRPYPRS